MMAPNANITLIETTTESDTDYATAVVAGVQAVGAQVVLLTGFDNPEGAEGKTGDQFYQIGDLPPSIFNQPGVTFIDGSGDTGTPSLALGDYPDVVDVAASNTTLNNDAGNFLGSTRASWGRGHGLGRSAAGHRRRLRRQRRRLYRRHFSDTQLSTERDDQRRKSNDFELWRAR